MARYPLIAAMTTATILLPVTMAHGARPVVAVFTLESKDAPLTAADLDKLSDYIGSSLIESGRFEVVPPDDLKAALRRQKAESYEDCYAESCQIEVGKELAAAKTLAGSVSRLGERCLINLKLYDLIKSTQEAAGTAAGACAVEDTFDSLQVALAKLTGAPNDARVAEREDRTDDTKPSPRRSLDPAPDAQQEMASAPENRRAPDFPPLGARPFRAPSPDRSDDVETRPPPKLDRQAKPMIAGPLALTAEALGITPQLIAPVTHKAAEAVRGPAETDWEKILPFVEDDDLAPMLRVKILKQFLEAFGANNPHIGDAMAQIRRLVRSVERASSPTPMRHRSANQRHRSTQRRHKRKPCPHRERRVVADGQAIISRDRQRCTVHVPHGNMSFTFRCGDARTH